MKIELQKQILNEDDEPILDEKTKKPVTLGTALKRLSLAEIDHEQKPISGEAKIARYEIYLKLRLAKGDVVDLTPEDVTLLRQAALSYPTLVAGQVRALLA